MKKENRIIIFTGSGKGKTTAALGMALRASGHNQKIFILQFIKNDPSTGELAAINRLPNIKIVQAGLGFVPKKNDRLQRSASKFKEHCKKAEEALHKAREVMECNNYNLIILDEIITALSLDILKEKDVIEIIKLQKDCNLVLTGRGATPNLIDLADTVTEMNCIRHGLDQGITAQEGVEY